MKDSETATLFRIAKRYYEDGKLQSEIAHDEGISRSLVSKLLAKARDVGIVKIDISLPVSSSGSALEEMLHERLCASNAVVFPYSGNGNEYSEWDAINAVAIQSAVLLPNMLSASLCVGIGWGRTIYRISDELRFIDPKHEMTFVPLVGNSGLYNRYLQTSSIANRFAEKYASRCFYPNVSFDRSQSSKLTPFERASIDELSSLWNHIDTAIFSLSSASSVDNYYLSEFSDSLSPSSVHLSACGEIFSQAYFADGSTESFVEEYPITAFPLEKLRQIKNTICIAVGPSKAYSIIWALRCGFVNTLITDVPTAEAIQIILDEET